MVQVRVRDHGVLAHNVHGLDGACCSCVEHLDQCQARVRDLPVSGQHIGQCAHVTCALYIVLAPKRINSTARNTHVAAEHGQVGQGLYIVCARGMLGNAHAVDNAGCRGFCIQPGSRN